MPDAGSLRQIVMDLPSDGDGFLRRETAVALGIDPNQLRRRCERGELVRIAPGVFALPADRTPEEQHRLRLLAAPTTSDAVFSHASAAVLHGLPMLMPDLSRIHLTSAGSDRGYRRDHRHLHPGGGLAEHDLVQVDGCWATSLERTAFDIARTTPHGFAGALAVVDAALRREADRSAMAAMARTPQTGVGVARRALRHAEREAENPGESWGRAQMIVAGLPMPRLQHEFFDDHRRFVARTDYDWVGEGAPGRPGVVGEFDGLGKYVKYLRPGESARDVIAREKEREGRLQDLGLIVVRWTWADLAANRVVPRVRRQLAAVGLPRTQTPPDRAYPTGLSGRV